MTLLEAYNSFKQLLILVDDNYNNILKHNSNIMSRNIGKDINDPSYEKEWNPDLFFNISKENMMFLEKWSSFINVPFNKGSFFNSEAYSFLYIMCTKYNVGDLLMVSGSVPEARLRVPDILYRPLNGTNHWISLKTKLIPQKDINQYNRSFYIAKRDITSNHLFSIDTNLKLFPDSFGRLDYRVGFLLLKKEFLSEVEVTESSYNYWEAENKKEIMLKNMFDLKKNKNKIHPMLINNFNGYEITPIPNLIAIPDFNIDVTFWVHGFLPSLWTKVSSPMLNVIKETNFGSKGDLKFVTGMLLKR